MSANSPLRVNDPSSTFQNDGTPEEYSAHCNSYTKATINNDPPCAMIVDQTLYMLVLFTISRLYTRSCTSLYAQVLYEQCDQRM